MEPKNPYSFSAWAIFGTKLSLWTVWCLPWGAVGIALCATALGIVPGLACLSIAAWPLKKMLATRNLRVVQWEQRWSYVEEDSVENPPWEV